MNTDIEPCNVLHNQDQTCLLYHRRLSGIEDKFINLIMHNVGEKNSHNTIATPIFKQWQEQSDFVFVFIPHSEQVMPDVVNIGSLMGLSVFQIHALVQATGKHNYIGVRIPVKSQLNVAAWKAELIHYWDQQLIEFGYPLDFNRQCPLKFEGDNHTSATEYPADIEAYIQEEPIPGGHCSPFMTRHKPNSERHRVIIDPSWHLGASVNAGIDKNTYLGSDFELTFPSVDDITDALRCLGKGVFLYKVNVSHAFCHVKVDPGDYNLLGLQWNGMYIDTCLPSGMCHGSQIFQHLSDAVCYIMHQNGHCIIDYIDNYVGVGVPDIASKSFHFLIDLLSRLGLTIGEKKLIKPGTRVVCLGK